MEWRARDGVSHMQGAECEALRGFACLKERE